MEVNAVVPRRSLPFVPGLRLDRLRKALIAGADRDCVDLEDAVAVDQKDEARRLALPVLAESRPSTCEALVRINSLDMLRGMRDIEALTKLDKLSDATRLPEAKAAPEIHLLDELLQG
jgi:citrate lyase beta subunit